MAARMRTSTRIGRAPPPPTRSISRASIARSSLACASGPRSATSSRKRVPVCASSKRPMRRSVAPVKAPRSCPNISALDEVARDGRAIHADERPVAARTRAVDGRGHELLAGPRFAADENARVGRRDAGDEIGDAAHLGTRADQLPGVPQLVAQNPGRVARREPGRAQLQRGAQREQQPFRREGFLEKGEGAELRGPHRIGEAGPAAHHDHRHVGIALAEPGQRREAIHRARHHEVEERDVGSRILRRGDGAGAVRGVAHLVSLAPQQGADHPADVRLVVDDEDRWHRRGLYVALTPPRREGRTGSPSRRRRGSMRSPCRDARGRSAGRSRARGPFRRACA